MKTIILTERQIKRVIDQIISEQPSVDVEKGEIGLTREGGVNSTISTNSKYFTTQEYVFFDRNEKVEPGGYKSRKMFSFSKVPLDMIIFTHFYKNKNKEGADPAISVKDENQLSSSIKNYMDEESKIVFDSIKEKNPNFYYYVLIEWYSNQSDLVKGKNSKIVVDDSETIKQEIVPGMTEEKKPIIFEEGVKIVTEGNVEQPIQFVFNEADMTPEFMEYINKNLFEQIDQSINELKTKLGAEGRNFTDVYVSKLMIRSSCSTIPNGESKRTFPGKVPTFSELSKARADVVYNYVAKGLQQRKATFAENAIIIDSKGSNAGKKITIKNGSNADGTPRLISVDGTGTSGPEYNGTNKEALKIFQRVDFDIEFAVRGDRPPQSRTVEPDKTPPQTIPVKVTDFIVRFTTQGRLKLRLKLPKIMVSWRSNGKFKIKPHRIGCPLVY